MHADQYTALPLFLSTGAALDLPPVPALETLPMIPPEREPDLSLYSWCVESLEAARAWKEEAEALAVSNRYLRDELARAVARERAQRWRWVKDLALTAGCVFVMGAAVLIVLNALP
jgi:hypothetical protein